MFALGESLKGAEISLRVYLDAIKIMLGARRLGGIRYLSARDRDFIEHWEVEQYRRSVAARSGRSETEDKQ